MTAVLTQSAGGESAAARFRLQPIPTAYDPGADQVTIATPSCCCCCCSCCLASTASAATFFVVSTKHRAEEAGGNGRLAALVAFGVWLVLTLSFVLLPKLTMMPFSDEPAFEGPNYAERSLWIPVLVVLGAQAGWIYFCIWAAHLAIRGQVLSNPIAWGVSLETTALWLTLFIAEFVGFLVLTIAVLNNPPSDLATKFWLLEAALVAGSTVLTLQLVRLHSRTQRRKVALSAPAVPVGRPNEDGGESSWM